MKKSKGFTLIELLVVIAIIGILLSYAIPSYQRNVIESIRTEAQNSIMLIAAAEESHNANYQQYTIVLAGSGNDGNSLGLGNAEFTTSVNYDYTVRLVNGYTISAAAKGNTQVNDNFGIDCTSLTLNGLGQKTPLGCWQ